MSGKTVQYWLSHWDDSQSNVQNILNCLQEYVGDSNATTDTSSLMSSLIMGISSLLWTNTQVSNNARIPEVTKALLNFKRLNASNNSQHIDPSVEEILACIKQTMNTYQSYVFNTVVKDKWSRNFQRNPKPNEFLITKFTDSYFNYKVIAPNNKIEEGVIRYRHFLPLFEVSITIGELRLYANQILDITSKLGHTRGSHLNGTDDLATLLQVVKIKTEVDYFSLDYRHTLDRYQNLDMLVSIDNVSQWKKQGDFTQRIRHGSLDRSLCYINTTTSDKIIRAIHLLRYTNGKLALHVTTSNHATFDQLKKEIVGSELPPPNGCEIQMRFLDHGDFKNHFGLDKYFYLRGVGSDHYSNMLWEARNININNLDKFNALLPLITQARCFDDMQISLTSVLMNKLIPLIDYAPPAFGSSETNDYILYAPDSSAKSLNIFASMLEVLLRIDASTLPVLNDLNEALSIHHVLQAAVSLQEVTNDAIALQNKQHYDPIWNLAISCRDDYFSEEPQKNISFDQLVLLFKTISVNSPYYANANDELCDLTMGIERDGLNNDALLEQVFRYAFKGTNQTMTDCLYNELCGKGLSSTKITDLKGDEDSVVARAAQFREANNKQGHSINGQAKPNSNSNRVPLTCHAKNPNILFNATGLQENQGSPLCEFKLEGFHKHA